MRLRFTHSRLLVEDFKACFHFYNKTLGFAVVWGNEDGNYAEFDTGAAKIAIFRRHLMAEAMGKSLAPACSDSQDTVALVFAVEDVDKSYRELKEHDIIFVSEPMDKKEWGIRAAHFRDPDGNLIEINCDLRA